MKRINKVLYEQIIYSISKEIKKILNEDLQGFDVTDYDDDDNDIINNQTIQKVADPNNELPYIELKEACADIPEVYIQKSLDKRYIANIFFNDYFYRFLDEKIDIDSQGETWITVTPSFSATIVAIGSRSGEKYTKKYGKFKTMEQLVEQLRKDIENYRLYLPIDLTHIKPSAPVKQIMKQLISKKLNFNLPKMSKNTKYYYMTTFEPQLYINDRVYKNKDYNKGDVYIYSFTKNKSSLSYTGKDTINNIAKQIEYDLSSNEEIDVIIRFGMSYGYDEKEYDRNGLNKLADAFKKYITKIYKVRIFEHMQNYDIQLSGNSSNILSMVQTALDIIDKYEAFINKYFNKHIKIY